MLNKRGQVAIFVIVGIVIVSVIVVVFLAIKNPTLTRSSEFEPSQFINLCVRESASETLSLMIPQGGFVDPSDYKIYKDIKVPYLCKNVNNFVHGFIAYSAQSLAMVSLVFCSYISMRFLVDSTRDRSASIFSTICFWMVRGGRGISSS